MNQRSAPSSAWIVIPAYQAQAQVGAVVAAAVGQGHRVLVVDDGSTDHTGDAAEQAGATVLRHARNRGKGAALQTGFAAALRCGAAAVLTMDADGQHDPAEIPALLRAHADDQRALVIGVRRFDPAIMPRSSRIGNTISTFFISRFAGQRFQDTQSGFRVYPEELLRRAPLTTRRFETETELLLWAGKLGLPVREVPIQTIYHRVPGQPRATHFRVGEDTLRVIRLVIGSPWWRPVAPASGPRRPQQMTQPMAKVETT